MALQLVNDFITEDKLLKFRDGKFDQAGLDFARLNEEINLLYVAVTRTKNSIHMPEDLLPSGIQTCDQIHVLRNSSQTLKKEPKANTQKSYFIDEQRKNNKSAYMPWTQALDKELRTMYTEGISIKDMAKHFGRTKGAVASRIKKLNLEKLFM